MSFKAQLFNVVNSSGTLVMNGYEIEQHIFDREVLDIWLPDGNETVFSFLEQEVTVNDDGDFTAEDKAGAVHQFATMVSKPLTEMDLIHKPAAATFTTDLIVVFKSCDAMIIDGSEIDGSDIFVNAAETIKITFPEIKGVSDMFELLFDPQSVEIDNAGSFIAKAQDGSPHTFFAKNLVAITEADLKR